MARVAMVLLALALTGCGGAPIAPTYTEEELGQICVRRGGWWHPDQLTGGNCEFEASGSGLP